MVPARTRLSLAHRQRSRTPRWRPGQHSHAPRLLGPTTAHPVIAEGKRRPARRAAAAGGSGSRSPASPRCARTSRWRVAARPPLEAALGCRYFRGRTRAGHDWRRQAGRRRSGPNPTELTGSRTADRVARGNGRHGRPGTARSGGRVDQFHCVKALPGDSGSSFPLFDADGQLRELIVPHPV